MARIPTVWLRKADRFFYTTIRGKKIKLSRNRKKALKAFHTLLAKDDEAVPVASMAFRKLADLFLDESQRTKKPNTYRLAKYTLQSFCDAIGNCRVADLRVLHVTEWVKTKGWNESSACSAGPSCLPV